MTRVERVTFVALLLTSTGVRMTVRTTGSVAELTLRNALPVHPRRELPSGGTGLRRLADRVRELGGDFSAGIDGSEWAVVVRMPLA